MRLFLGCNTIAEFDAVPDAPRCSPVKLQHIMPWSSESGFWEATGQFQADGWQPSLASSRSSTWSDLRGGRVQGRAHMPSRLTNSTLDTSPETPIVPAAAVLHFPLQTDELPFRSVLDRKSVV